MQQQIIQHTCLKEARDSAAASPSRKRRELWLLAAAIYTYIAYRLNLGNNNGIHEVASRDWSVYEATVNYVHY